MTALATRPVDHPSGPGARAGSRLARWWSLPLRWHALALAVVLLGALVLTHPFEPSISDEGAALAQVAALDSGNGWLVEHPLPQVDPDGRAFPIDLSLRRTGTDLYAPLAKHPLYATLLRAPMRAAGVPGAFMVSIAGTVLAAIAAAVLTRRLAPGAENVALWLVGLATPLFYDSYLLIAHSLGAACVGWSVVALTSSRRRHALAIGAGLALLFGAQLFRNEAVLLGIALALAIAVHDRAYQRRNLLLAGAVLVTTAAGHLLDGFLTARAIGGATSEVADPITYSGNVIEQRWRGFLNATLRLSGSSATSSLLVASTFGCLVCGAYLVRRRADRERLGSALFLAAGACAIAAYVLSPGEVEPGLATAAPVFVGGLIMVDIRGISRQLGALLATTASLFALAVFASQYADAGNVWGGRFLAIGLPIAAPLAAAGLRRSVRRVQRTAARAIVVGTVTVSLALAVTAATSLSNAHRYAAAMDRAVAAVAAGVPAGDGDARPVVVVTNRSTGRLLYRRTEHERWLTVLESDLPLYGGRLRDAGIRRIVLVTSDPDRSSAQLGALYRQVGEPHWASVSLPFGRTATLSEATIILEAR